MRLLNSVIVLASLLFTMIAHSQLPALSQEDREAYSSSIVTGKVEKIKKKVRKIDSETQDYVFTVTMSVDNVEKGPKAKHMKFTFWKALKRPDAWCGHTGQNGMIMKKDHIRAYITVDEHGHKELIEPNGFDKL